MKFESTKRVVEEFTNRLHIPNSDFNLLVGGGENGCEVTLAMDGTVLLNLMVTVSDIRVVYTNDYESIDYESQEYNTSVDLVYYLLIFIYSTLLKNGTGEDLGFNDFLSLVLSSTVTDWKSLFEAIAMNLGMICRTEEDFVVLADMPVTLNPFSGEIVVDDMTFTYDHNSYTELIRAIFMIMSYFAVLMQKEDSMFEIDEQVENLEEAEEAMEEGDRDFDFDMDFDMDFEGGGAPPAPEAETEEPEPEPEEEPAEEI